MGFENIPRWGWAMIGVIAGLVIAYVHTGMEPSYPRTIGGQEFEREISAHDVPGDLPRIQKVTIHPAVQGAYNKPVQVLTFLRATYSQKDQGWIYYPHAFRAELPYKPATGEFEEAPTMSQVLAAAQVNYRYAWWEEPKWTYTLWTVGSAVVIGGIWPSIIDLLIGAGLARPRKTKEEKAAERAYLDRFGKGKAEASSMRPAAQMSDAERARLEKMTDDMEEGLAASATHRTSGVAVADDQGPVKKLDGGPLEIANIQKEEEDKEYKGEFYPVAHPAHHKPIEPPHGPASKK